MFWEVMTVLVISAAFFFLLTNGLHDASSVVATMIGCGAAIPRNAVLFAGALELAGAIFGGSAVAYTIAKMIDVPPGPMLILLLLVALISATVWNIITWKVGLPSSSSHALIGGLIGAVWIASGPSYIVWGFNELWQDGQLTGIAKVIVGLVISPIIGFLIAYGVQIAAKGLLKNTCPGVTNCWLKRAQWVVVATLAYSHGANDTQKIMGVVILALVAIGQTANYDIPLWLRIVVGVIMFLGIMCGGWTIMKTLGRDIYPLRPVHSFDSLFTSGLSLLTATNFGVPVSTTHLVVGSIVGVGTADECKMVNWRIGQSMVVAWCTTIPASAVFSASMYVILRWAIGDFAGGI